MVKIYASCSCSVITIPTCTLEEHYICILAIYKFTMHPAISSFKFMIFHDLVPHILSLNEAGVKEVIRGWDLAIMEMKVGESRKLIIPAELVGTYTALHCTALHCTATPCEVK